MRVHDLPKMYMYVTPLFRRLVFSGLNIDRETLRKKYGDNLNLKIEVLMYPIGEHISINFIVNYWNQFAVKWKKNHQVLWRWTELEIPKTCYNILYFRFLFCMWNYESTQNNHASIITITMSYFEFLGYRYFLNKKSHGVQK